MDKHWHPLSRGLVLTVAIAALVQWVIRLPGFGHFGPLTPALILGMAWKAFGRVSPAQNAGIGFSARQLLRLGIVLLGVRLNFKLLAHAGLKIIVIDLSVITVGIGFITWLGARFGLEPAFAGLIAVDSSICGASAAAAAAPVLRARNEEMALVIPLCSLVGTCAMLLCTLAQGWLQISPVRYGMFAGASLHEVAQVMAAVAAVPAAVEVGMITKLTRVLMLVPVIVFLGWRLARRDRAEASGNDATTPLPRPWFVAGFLAVGIVNSLALHFMPASGATLARVDDVMLTVATFLMATAMAGMGLKIDFARLRANGPRAVATAVLGWCGVAAIAASEVWLLGV